MKKKIVVLLMVISVLLAGCTAQNDEVLQRLDEMEQRISQLEQTIGGQTAPEENTEEELQATPEPTEAPIEPKSVADVFMDIVPDSFVPFADNSKILDASIYKEYNMYGISMHYSLDADADTEDIIEYYKKVMGDDADVDSLEISSGVMFQTSEGDFYYVGLDQMSDSEKTLYIEVQFSDADFSNQLDNADLDVSNYHLDEIFAGSPTMVKMGIVMDEYMEKEFYYEYKDLDTDCDGKIEPVYSSYGAERMESEGDELVYRLPDGAIVTFEIYDNSNRVNVAISYYK